MRIVTALLLFGILAVSSCEKPDLKVRSASDDKLEGTVLFLGDNLTHTGEFIAHLDAVLYSKSKKVKKGAPHVDLINLGLPSETCSGLTEGDRDFPRPVIHERLDRALEMVKPDTVFVCYGTLDGIYSPFSEERFAAFKNGINLIIEKVHAANANVVLMTPPPFDIERNRAKNALKPSGAEVFGYYKLYENYDTEVIATYSEWILQQSPRVEGVVNLREPLLSFLNEKRLEDPTYTFSGNGAILDSEAHKVIAKTILSSLEKDPSEVDSVWLRYRVRSEKRQEILHPAWLSHVGYKVTEQPKSLPVGIPLQEAVDAADEVAQIVESEYKEKVKAESEIKTLNQSN